MHRLLRTSTDPDVTFQFFEVELGGGVLQLCNIYSAPTSLQLAALPPPPVRGTVYAGDFNARHPALGDRSGTTNRPGALLLSYICRHHLTRWDAGGATHFRGGTLDHVLTAGLVSSRVQCSSVPSLFSDHVALLFRSSLPTVPTPPVSHLRITVPLKYCPTYVSYMARLLPAFDCASPDQLYSSLVSATHDFYRLCVKATPSASPCCSLVVSGRQYLRCER